jgi:hypothetical protein
METGAAMLRVVGELYEDLLSEVARLPRSLSPR